MKSRLVSLIAAILLAVALPAVAQDAGKPAAKVEQSPARDSHGRSADQQGRSGEPRGEAGLLALLPPDSVTEHSLDLPGGRIDYTATAGTLNIYGQNGERTAAVFYTAYARRNAPAGPRPVTFAFNGGPGAASAYLHFGLVGPKVLDFGPLGRDGAAARLIDNPDTWLRFTDLVLIDPIGAGWSRTAKPGDARNFWSVNADAELLAKVIALYVAHNSRQASPKYLLGESYGGFRSAKVARALQNDQGIIVSGIVMVSPLIDGGLQFADRLALGAALRLPSLAAAELERRNAFSPAAMAQVEHFAMTEYLTTLAGSPPQGEAATRFYARVAELTGVAVEDVARTRGFIRNTYVRQGQGAATRIVSAYDAGISVPDPFPEQGAGRQADPVLDGFSRALGGAFVAYARDELGFKTDITYQLLAREIAGKWDWKSDSGPFSPPNAERDLREMLSLNPSFRLLVTHGYTDLVTPYMASRYVLDHLPPNGAPERVQLKLYPGGHMMYFDARSRAALTRDVAAFYRGSD